MANDISITSVSAQKIASSHKTTGLKETSHTCMDELYSLKPSESPGQLKEATTAMNDADASFKIMMEIHNKLVNAYNELNNAS